MKEFNQKIKRSAAFHISFKFIKFLLRIFFKIFFRIKIYGKEKIPLSGKLILCSNHLSYIDPVVIESFFPRIIFFMGKIEIFNNRFLNSFFKFFNVFPVDRKGFSRFAIRHSYNILEKGEILGLFPEGSRSTDGIIGEGQKGVGLIAAMSNSSILPVAIAETNNIIQKPRKRIFFPKIKLIFGDLIDTDKIIKNNSLKDSAEIITLKTMEEIKKLSIQIKKAD